MMMYVSQLREVLDSTVPITGYRSSARLALISPAYSRIYIGDFLPDVLICIGEVLALMVRLLLLLPCALLY